MCPLNLLYSKRGKKEEQWKCITYIPSPQVLCTWPPPPSSQCTYTLNIDCNSHTTDLEAVSGADVCLDSTSIPQTPARTHGLASKKIISSWATLRAPVFILKGWLSHCLCFCLSVPVFMPVCVITCIWLFVCLPAQYQHNSSFFRWVHFI